MIWLLVITAIGLAMLLVARDGSIWSYVGAILGVAGALTIPLYLAATMTVP